MAEIAGRRMTAEIEGDFVVFLIGPTLNSKLHLLRSFMDLGGRRGMRYMLDYLVEHPEKGLLAYEMGLPTIVQYWRSFEHLEAFAKDKDDPHLEVWRNYWRRVGRSGRTGIWHETFLVRAGEYEAVYGNTRPRGLGKAGRLVPVAGILKRARAAEGDDHRLVSRFRGSLAVQAPPRRRRASSSNPRAPPVHVGFCVLARHPPVTPLGATELLNRDTSVAGTCRAGRRRP